MANQDPTFSSLVKRFHTVYFLATPHRGSDLAKMLSNIIKVCYGKKVFVKDLHRNSGAISALNDSFRHCSKDLHLWSFYEGEKSTILLADAIVVDKSSATLAYANERIAPLNADHRGVCKFDTPSDPNYKTLRDALSTTIADIAAQGKCQVSLHRTQANLVKRPKSGKRLLGTTCVSYALCSGASKDLAMIS